MTQDDLPADVVTDLFLSQWNERAQRAYNVYGASVGWKNYAGHQMPAWVELPRRIQGAWCLATQMAFVEATVACRALYPVMHNNIEDER